MFNFAGVEQAGQDLTVINVFVNLAVVSMCAVMYIHSVLDYGLFTFAVSCMLLFSTWHLQSTW